MAKRLVTKKFGPAFFLEILVVITLRIKFFAPINSYSLIFLYLSMKM